MDYLRRRNLRVPVVGVLDLGALAEDRVRLVEQQHRVDPVGFDEYPLQVLDGDTRTCIPDLEENEIARGFQVEHETLEKRRAFLYQPERLARRWFWFEHVTLPALLALGARRRAEIAARVQDNRRRLAALVGTVDPKFCQFASVVGQLDVGGQSKSPESKLLEALFDKYHTVNGYYPDSVLFIGSMAAFEFALFEFPGKRLLFAGSTSCCSCSCARSCCRSRPC